MKTLYTRQTNQFGHFLKTFIFILFFTFVIHCCLNFTELWGKFREVNDAIIRLQQNDQRGYPVLEKDYLLTNENRKVSQTAIGNSRTFEDLTEKERAELMGLDDGITDEIRRIMKELNVTDVGENGNPVKITFNQTDYIKKTDQMMRAKYGYNALASGMISLNRALPDNRSEYCKTKKYPKNLPKASVIVMVHDDDWMLLMRTVHSILLRTPNDILAEVLLVFDHSDREYLQEHLDEYIKNYPKIRLVRSHRRQGIIPTRILGGRNAIGPVIVYLDSHVEVTPGWLEPILARIAEEPTLLAWPKVSGMDSETMQVTLDDAPGFIGTFSWDLVFKWVTIEFFEGDKPTPKYDPKPSATIIGAAFAIRKDFLLKIGLFDPDFDIWGSEDVELAFRVWMCGGRVELIPCAVVTHMFKTHTYETKVKSKNSVLYNNDRIAEIWLDDEYKKYYYRTVGDTKTRDYGNITERLILKKELNCKSFKWYMENVNPKRYIPDNLKDENWFKAQEEEKKKQEEEKRKKVEESKKIQDDKAENKSNKA
ncbi:inactive polypeptide N-acetylgalactosaminyltransferase-like protein 5 [Chironomus tepperi]|uniref:inactive polypeptide N-acetylgalactosaminyltransferase-like protein 5 n=1 Tax=Chironomus tepperi TaxID=113505 RepID=UPI00391FBC97